MIVLAESGTLSGQPRWLLDLLTAGWEQADPNKVLKRNEAIPAPIYTAFARGLDDLIQAGGLKSHFGGHPDVDGWQGGLVHAWHDPTANLAFNLHTAYSAKTDLTQCHHCEALMWPSKGRISKYCSGKCRTAATRKERT